MKKWLAGVMMLGFLATSAFGVLTFYLVDNFDDGTFSKWAPFDNVKLSIMKNPKADKRDLVLESCGEYALKVSGATKNWYIGGISTSFSVDPNNYSRLQLDVLGSKEQGKIKIELYEDDDKSGEIEQDPDNGWKPTKDDIWSVEIPILKDGYTRYSIPLTAFSDTNPGVGNDKLGGAGPLLKMQVIFIANKQEGSIDCAVDNIMFTY